MKLIMNRLRRERCASMMPLIMALAPLLLAGCGKTAKEKEPVVSVQVTPAQRGPISQIVSAEAVVSPLEQAAVAPKITARVKKFYVQRGSRVKKGQLMAVLENADLAATALSSKGDLEQADAAYKTTVGASVPQQLQKAQSDAESAKAAYEAQQKVYESRKQLFQQGAIAKRELDSAEVATVQARGQYEQAQKALADLQRLGQQQALKSAEGSFLSAEGKYRNAEAQLSYSEIRSPIDGVVTDRPLFEGDQATANQPMLTVMNLSRLIAKAHIAQAEAATLKVGNPADMRVPGLDDPVPSRVTLVSPALDPGSTTIEVWVEAVKPNPAVKPGMTVQVLMTAKTVKDAVVVPTSAIYKNADGNYVLLAGSDNLAHQKVVQVGITNGSLAQIVSGINAGDPVITSGGYALPDKTQIKIEAAAPAEKDTGAGDGAGKSDKAGDAAKSPEKAKE
jgi:HlyD family secretion protein